LSEVAEVRGGIAKNSNQVIEDPIQVAYLRVANVQDGYLDLTDLNTIEISKQDLKRFSVFPGDVLMNEGGDLDKLGRGAVWRGLIDPCVHQNHVFVVRCKPRLLPEYLDLWTGTPPARQFFLLAGKQTTNLASISKSSLSDLPVALPPIEEQRAITSAFADVDALTSGLNRLIAKKLVMKQAAIRHLLSGRIRLPGFTKAWHVRPLSELCTMKSGASITAESIDGHSTYPCYGGNGLRGYTSKFTHDGEYALIGRQGALCGNVTGVNGRFFASEHALVATPMPHVSIKWLTHVLRLLNLNQYSESSAQPGLSATKLLTLEAATPPTFDEQEAIAFALSDIEKEIAALESRLNKSRAIKQGMMQELLTGRTRLI